LTGWGGWSWTVDQNIFGRVWVGICCIYEINIYVVHIHTHMSQPILAIASHNRWDWLFGQYGPCCANLLLIPPSQYDSVLNHTWNSGRHAPGVTLTLTFDAPMTVLRLCPRMNQADGFVGLIIVFENAERIAHREFWRENQWVEIALPTPASVMSIDFVESPSWIALHAVEAS
jgi:hypothetical protein